MITQLRTFCIKHDYFTAGTNNQYSKFFDLASNGATVKELAIIIYICSEDKNIEVIETQLKNELFLNL